MLLTAKLSSEFLKETDCFTKFEFLKVRKKYVDLLKGASPGVCVNSLALLCSEHHVAAAQRIKKIVRIE
jgi:hypothetical protein